MYSINYYICIIMIQELFDKIFITIEIIAYTRRVDDSDELLVFFRKVITD